MKAAWADSRHGRAYNSKLREVTNGHDELEAAAERDRLSPTSCPARYKSSS